MWKILLIAPVALAVAGCARMSLEAQLLDRLEARCGAQPACTIDLAEATGFAWERMYVFPEGTSRETIAAIAGVADPDPDTIAERMLFVAGGAIVRREETLPDVDSRRPRNLVFEAKDPAQRYFVVDRARSRVDVRVEKSGERVFYVLTPAG